MRKLSLFSRKTQQTKSAGVSPEKADLVSEDVTSMTKHRQQFATIAENLNSSGFIVSNDEIDISINTETHSTAKITTIEGEIIILYSTYVIFI